jgi:hypothetical protein
MKPMLKKALIVLICVAALLLLAAVTLPFLIDADAFRPEIESAMSESLGKTVTLGPLSVSPGLGIWIRTDRVEIADPPGGAGPGTTVVAENVRFKVAALPLLRGEIEIRTLRFRDGGIRTEDEVLASGLALKSRLRRTAEGIVLFAGNLSGRADTLGIPDASVDFTTRLEGERLEIESLVARIGPGRIEGAGHVVGIGQEAMTADLTARGVVGATRFDGAFLVTILEEITDVEFEVEAPMVDFDELGAIMGWIEPAPGQTTAARHGSLFPAARAADLAEPATAPEKIPVRARGVLTAERARFSGLELTGFRSHVVLDDGTLRFDDAVFDLYGGAHDGRFEVDLEDPGLSYRLESAIEGVDLNGLVSAWASDTAGLVQGTGALSLDVAGRAGEEGAEGLARGTARLDLRDGSLSGEGLMKQLSEALAKYGAERMEGDRTVFDEIFASFTIGDRRLRTEDFRLRSPDLDLDGRGAIGFDLAVAMDVTAALSPEVTRNLVAQVPQLEFRVGQDGRLTAPMKVGGTLAEPVVVLDVQKILEEGLGDSIRDRLKGLFGGD